MLSQLSNYLATSSYLYTGVYRNLSVITKTTKTLDFMDTEISFLSVPVSTEWLKGDPTLSHGSFNSKRILHGSHRGFGDFKKNGIGWPSKKMNVILFPPKLVLCTLSSCADPWVTYNFPDQKVLSVLNKVSTPLTFWILNDSCDLALSSKWQNLYWVKIY